jgi:hypothetical protein
MEISGRANGTRSTGGWVDLGGTVFCSKWLMGGIPEVSQEFNQPSGVGIATGCSTPPVILLHFHFRGDASQ